METLDLRQFTGSDVIYRHPLNRKVFYTEGIRYLATEANAYWLIDTIASHIGGHQFNDAVDRDCRIGTVHFWTLEVDPDRVGQLFAKPDSPEEPFITQSFTWTDFPLQKVDIWAGFNSEYWTLYLPGEH